MQLGEKRVYFTLRIIQHITEGRPGRNSSKITGCNHGGMQLTSLLPGHIQLLFLHSPSPLTCLISLTVTWLLLQQLTIKNVPHAYPLANLIKKILQLKLLLPRHVKLTIKVDHHNHLYLYVYHFTLISYPQASTFSTSEPTLLQLFQPFVQCVISVTSDGGPF